MMIRTLAVAATLAACAVSDAKSISYDVNVELASVTLADNCAVATPPPDPRGGARSKPARATKGDVDIDERSQDPPAPSARKPCEQTSMQLALTARPGIKATSIKIKRVELLDAHGKVLEVLTARGPTRWTPKGVYAAWNETIVPEGGTEPTEVKASYVLDAPNWSKLTNGRINAHSHTFQLRVTVIIGGADRTVEKTSITPARVQPRIVT